MPLCGPRWTQAAATHGCSDFSVPLFFLRTWAPRCLIKSPIAGASLSHIAFCTRSFNKSHRSTFGKVLSQKSKQHLSQSHIEFPSLILPGIILSLSLSKLLWEKDSIGQASILTGNFDTLFKKNARSWRRIQSTSRTKALTNLNHKFSFIFLKAQFEINR